MQLQDVKAEQAAELIHAWPVPLCQLRLGLKGGAMPICPMPDFSTARPMTKLALDRTCCHVAVEIFQAPGSGQTAPQPQRLRAGASGWVSSTPRASVSLSDVHSRLQ